MFLLFSANTLQRSKEVRFTFLLLPLRKHYITQKLLLDASYVFVQLQFVRQRFPKQKWISSEFHSFKRHVTVSSHKLIQTLGPLHEMTGIGPQRLSHAIWTAETLSAGYLLIYD